MTLLQSISASIDYCRAHNVDIPLDIQLQARKFGAWKASGGDLSAVNKKYHDAITSNLIAYFEGGSIASSRNGFKKAMIQAFGDAFDLGYTGAGGELPIEDDAMEWIGARMNQEAAYIDGLYNLAKLVRKDPEADYFSWTTDHADSYTATLQAIYNAGAMWAKRNQMLTWRYGDAEHCSTCNKLNGQRHRAAWFIARNYIPRQPGSNLECGGYRCKCSLLAPDGSTVTL